MRCVNLLHLKRSYRLPLILLLVSILLLLMLMVPHYTDSDELAFRGVRHAPPSNRLHSYRTVRGNGGIRDLIWSNESEPILYPRDACSLQHNSSIPEILVMVPSSLVNFERRAAIRNSWGDTPLVREGKIKVIFVLGQRLGRLAASQVLC